MPAVDGQQPGEGGSRSFPKPVEAKEANGMSLEDEFGDIVRKARRGLGLSEDVVAQEAAVSSERLARFEAYEARPLQEEVERLCGVLKLDARSLWAIATAAYLPQVSSFPRGVVIDRFVFSGMNSNGYLLRFEEEDVTVFVDPGGDPAPVFARLDETGWPLTAIFLTHGHADHVAGVLAMQKRTGAPVYAHGREWSGEGLIDLETVVDTDDTLSVSIGDVPVRILPTPGHTPWGLTFLFPRGIAAVGDTLFAGSLGGAFQGASSYPDLLASAQRIAALPPETLLLPGHGPMTTVALERENNPFIVAMLDAGER